MRSKYIVLVLALIGTLLAVSWQEVNLSHLKSNAPDREEFGRIITADDGSYVQPPLHWRATGVWKDYTIGSSSYVQRPPGYGMLFLIGTYVSPSNPYFFLKLIQILGFFLSIFIVYRLFKLFELNDRWSLIATGVYALLPTFNGFLYHVITEGITPVLLLWSMYEWILILKGKGNKIRWISSNAFLLLVRPQLGMFVLVFLLYLGFKKRFKLLTLALLIFLPFVGWMVRVYTYTGSVSLHPIYSEDNQSIYRPPHQELGELFKVWEYKSDRFHETLAMLKPGEDITTARAAAENVPENYRDVTIGMLLWYQVILQYQEEAMITGNFEPILKYERNFSRSVAEVREDLVLNNLTEAYLITPLKSAKELFVNSHLHLTIFQSKYRGQFWMEGLRWLSLFVILMGIAALFVVSVIWKRVPRYLWLICLASVVTIMYLIFVQRLNEERYLTPILPLAFIASVWILNATIQRFRKSV